MNPKLHLSLSKRAAVLTGAGFSHSVGLPLQRELLDSVVHPDMIKIHNYLMGRNFGDPADIEEFLSSIDFDNMLELKRSPDRLSSQTYLSGFAANIYNSIQDIGNLPVGTQKKFWKKLMTLAEVSDTFITLNWGTLIETLLRSLGKRIRFKGSDKRSKHVLKLHGSFDWYKLSSELKDAFDSNLFEKVFRGYVRYKPFSEKPLFWSQRRLMNFSKSSPLQLLHQHT